MANSGGFILRIAKPGEGVALSAILRRRARHQTKSLTTIEQFKPMIAHLPLDADCGPYMPTRLAILPDEGLSVTDLDHLFHALEIHASKRGLRASRGTRGIWFVNGFAQ